MFKYLFILILFLSFTQSDTTSDVLVIFRFVFGLFSVCFWFAFGSFLVRFWFVFALFLFRFWLVFSSFLFVFSVRFRFAFGSFSVSFRFAFGSFWFVFGPLLVYIFFPGQFGIKYEKIVFKLFISIFS